MKYLCYAMVGICLILALLGILIPDRAMTIISAVGIGYFFYCGKTWDKRKQIRKVQKPETIEEAMGKPQTKSKSEQPLPFDVSIETKWIDVETFIAKGYEVSKVNLNGYVSPSGNYMNYAIFEVVGIKPTTGRKNKRTYEAKDEAGALRAAAEDGLQDAEVVRALEEEPPTERQKECLEGLGVTIPQGACKYDVSAMIGRILDSQDIVEEIEISKTEEKQYVKPLESPSEELAIYADKMGLKFSKYISAGNLHGSIVLHLGDRDKAAYFAYCILCANSSSELGNLLEMQNKEELYEFADKAVADEALMRSINGREPQDYLLPHKGSVAYKAVAKFFNL